MTSRNRRLTQKHNINQRRKAPPQYPHQRCSVFGCARATQRSSKNVGSAHLCKPHQEHLRRHGHASRASYRKWELEPYRKAAREWLRQHRKDIYVKGAISRLDSLLFSQARSKDTHHQRSMAPRDKARNTLARLHEAGKTGEQLLLIVLTIKTAHAELGPHATPDWEAVQIAKQAKKLRGGSGVIQKSFDGRPMTEVHPHASTQWKRDWERWPRGEGIFMRHLGRMIEEKAAYAIDGEAIEEVKALRRTQ